jgi:cell fate regulator YaaT (PSP1 superfamily)
MAIIIGVRFREAGRVYYFNPGKWSLQKGDMVIVETSRGVECGEVAQEPTELPDDQIKHPLKEVIRAATQTDIRVVESKAAREAETFRICEEKILKHELDMKLVNVEINFEGSKIIFYFTADQRVDFRALVRDLASVFHTRIELRQIGVRDEAKLLGGLGICGRPFCCSQFMGEFHPVSIKMAKEQGLSLNPTKISGTCGRLMCCLKYEETAYEDALRHLPKVGSFVDTPEGRGLVTELNAVSGNIKVRLDRRLEAAPMAFRWDMQEGVCKAIPAPRQMAMTLPLLEEMANPAPEPPPEPERRPKPKPQTRQKPQKRRREPEAPPPFDKRPSQHMPTAPQPKPPSPKPPSPQARQPHQPKPAAPQAKQPVAQPGGEPAAGTGDKRRGNGGKNWRERHALQQNKPQPAYRQQPPAPPPHNKPAQHYNDSPAPRRALAPKPKDQ